MDLLLARQNLISTFLVFLLVVVLCIDGAFSQSSPTISQTAATGTISACEGIVSASPFGQQFTMSGANLVSPIVATAPSGFEISIAVGSGYGGQVTLTPTAGNVSNTVLYVRSSIDALAGYISGNVVLSSSGASTQLVKVVGVIQKRPTLQPLPNPVLVGGVNSAVINFSSLGTSTYTWTNDNVSIGLGANGTGSIPSFLPVNNGTTPKSATINVTPVATGFAYVASAYEDYVWVINTSTNTAVTKIKVGNSPSYVSASADGNRVYVSNASKEISVISPQSNTVIATIPLNVTPGSLMVTPDGNKLYVVASNSVLVINTVTNEVITTINNISHPSAVAVSPDGHYVYVAGTSLSIIDTTTDTITSTVTSSNLNSEVGICVSPDGSYVYMSSPFGKVAVFSTATQQITTINVGQQGAYGLAISPDGRFLYAPNRDSNTVSVIDTRTNLVIANIPLDNSPQGISVNSDGTRVYAVTMNYEVYVINTLTKTVINSIIVDDGAFSYGNFITPGTGCSGTAQSFTITVNPVGTPIVTVSPLSGNIVTCSGAASTNVAQFSVSGNNLTTDVILSAPTGLEISTSANSGYSSTITTTPTGGNVNNTLVYVRASSTAATGAISGNIFVSSTGAATQQVEVSGTVKALPSVPTGLSTQAFCNSHTISNLTPTGSNILWYGSPIGGSPLSSTTTLVDNSHYYASQSLNGCESPTRLDVIVSVNNVQAPTGNANQSFCTGAKVSDLSVTGTNIKWYVSASGSSGYLPTDILRDTNGWSYYYYASQTVNGCESPTRFNVTVHINTIFPTAPSFAYTSTWQNISTASSNNIALKTDGTLWTWGPNSYGQLGDGTTVSQSSPIQIGIDNNWETVVEGAASFGIKSDKTLWAWGNNATGQLGDGTTVGKKSPIQVGTSSNWKSISSYTHVIALRMDGTLWAWGKNDKGQLGNGTTTTQLTPIQIGTDTDWAETSTGIFHTLALKTNGTLWAWGDDFYGQLGDGDQMQASKNTPIQIGTDTNWKSVHATALSSFAIKKDGTLWGWSWGDYFKMKTVPTQIGSDNNWLTIAPGPTHVIGIKTNGTLWAWGYNDYGQLGNGVDSNTYTSAPFQVGTDTDWASVSVGDAISLAIKSDGTLWEWGKDIGYLIPTHVGTPNGLALETFCSTSTVANLTAIGTDIKWYAAASAGVPIDPPTALQDGLHYYATQTVNYCESQSRMDAVALVKPTPIPPPTGPASQTFSHPVTINALLVQGTGVKWYGTSAGGPPLSSSTVLNSGSHYYASQTIKGCGESSSRLDVLVTTVADTQPPTLVSTTPPTGSTNVTTGTSLVLSFSESIALGSGSVRIYNASTDVQIAAIALTSSNTLFAGAQATIAPPSSLPSNTAVYIKVDNGAFKDQANNAFAGILDKSWSFTTASSLLAPVANAATAITGNGFTANWNSSAGATGYQIDISTDNFTTFLTGYNSKVVTGISQIITGLTASTSYQYRVRGTNGSGTSTNSNVISVTTLTSIPPPVAITATGVSSSGFTANWNSVAGATNYVLDISTDNFDTFIIGYNSAFETGTSQIVTGLSASTTYQYRVRVTIGSGTSVSSNVISATTLFSIFVPVATTATEVSFTGFTANWTSVSGAINYQLDISTDNFSTFITGYNSIPEFNISQIVTGLTIGTTYQYRVRAITATGTSTNSNLISVTTLTSNSTPVATTATGVTSTGFTANWNRVSGATSYQLDISTDNFSTFITGYNSKTESGTSQIVTGLTAGTSYQYRVRVTTGSSISVSSNVISATTISPVPAPVATAATGVSSTGFTANWNSVSGATSYQLDISSDNFTTFLTGYNSKIETGTSQIVTGLTSGTSYQYRVRVTTTSGTSASSNVISVTTISPIQAPFALAATGILSTGFTANWSSVTSATSYQLDISIDDFVTFIAGYHSKTVSGTSQIVTGLTLGATYKYRVRAVDGSGSSINSNIITVLTPTKSSQAITFLPIPDVTIGDPSVVLVAFVDSGLPISFTSKITPAALAGNTFMIVLPGRDTIIATQPGNSTYLAATPVTQTFCINPAQPTVTISDDNTTAPTLTSSSNAGNQWFLNDVPISGATTRTLSITSPGVYTVTVKVDDCMSIPSDQVPLIVTGDIASLSTPPTLYPNPTRDFIFISGIHETTTTSSIIDPVGHNSSIMLEQQGDILKANISSLSSGLYILQVNDGNQIHQIKFIKQ